ncbi:MAG TPA: DUF4398 domain-containing protein [Steroidobacteraceae bacterium]|nr:DUF4398 domain-containing protein [Steroidobacteraceae bacterium]
MNPHSKKASITRRRFRIALPALLLLAGAAIAAPPVPVTNLQAAQQAIANAERVDAATHAGVELGEARGKLSAAQLAVEDKKMVVAQRFADEARAGAELAAAKSGAVKALAINEDIKRSTATLVDEMQRKSGDSR